MKTLNKSIGFLIIAAMLYVTAINAQNRNEKDNSKNIYAENPVQENTLSHNNRKSLKLSIIVTANDLYLKGATVKIYRNNMWIAALNNNTQPDLTVELERDSYYVLEVYKLGYISKSILISTVLPADSSLTQNDNRIYNYVVSVSLLKHVLFNSISKDVSAPINGIVYFDPNQDVYVGSPMVFGVPYNQAMIVQLENWLAF